jgi:predicted TIM-barrel fold metal-dependent hydrolase
MVIDCHVHLATDSGADFLKRLADECARLGIDRACLSPLNFPAGPGGAQWSNDDLIEALQQYPRLLIGFGAVRLGIDPPELVGQLRERGCRGLKITRPAFAYDDRRADPYYAQAAACEMPILFHTGTVARSPHDHLLDVDCNRMRPIYLDTIARRFPQLAIIGAHLGNPWYDEACMVAFWNPNVWFDLSGTTLKRKGAEWFRQMFWWDREVCQKLASNFRDSWYSLAASTESPLEKVVFGTDVPIDGMGRAMQEYADLMEALRLPQRVREKIMGGTMSSLLKL